MRSITFGVLLLAAGACSANTAPDSTTINVRLRDDAGAPAGRNLLVVSQTGRPNVYSQSGSSGTASLKVAEGGTYEITVVPRNEYIGGTELSKIVMVSDNAQASVDFTLHRAAVSSAEVPPFTPVER